LRDEPLLISHLIRVALTAITINSAGDGIENHLWDDSQLQVLASKFNSVDFFDSLVEALRRDRAVGNSLLESEVPDRNKLKPQNSSPFIEPSWKRHLLPGFIRLTQTAHALMIQNWLDIASKELSDSEDIEGLRLLNSLEIAEFKKRHTFNIHYNLARMLIPAYEKILAKTLRIQCMLDFLTTACALERYYIANQSYPETLDILVPEYVNDIPRDIMDHSVMRYERTEEGFFKLWSIGMNGEDDGGDSKDQKDWVWPME
jgi:hypothetical protein